MHLVYLLVFGVVAAVNRAKTLWLPTFLIGQVGLMGRHDDQKRILCRRDVTKLMISLNLPLPLFFVYYVFQIIVDTSNCWNCSLLINATCLITCMLLSINQNTAKVQMIRLFKSCIVHTFVTVNNEQILQMVLLRVSHSVFVSFAGRIW